MPPHRAEEEPQVPGWHVRQRVRPILEDRLVDGLGLAEVFAVVRLVADPDGARAEFSIVVRDDLAGKGLGRLLMRRIIEYATARGIRELFGDVLQANSRMIGLARHLGFRTEAVDQTADVVRVRLKIN